MKNTKGPRRPIDIKRDGAGSFSLAEPGGKIEGMLVVEDKMVIVSTRGVHQSQLADQVDPGRTDFRMPQMIQQRIICYGTETPFIVQTLLMAQQLFDTTHLGGQFDKGRALSLALKGAHDFAALVDILTVFEVDQVAGAAKLDDAVKGTSLNLPTTSNLQSRVGSYINHLRGICLSLTAIVELFFPKAKPNDPWRKAFDIGMQNFLDARPEFRETADYLCKFVEMIHNIRNALEHPDQLKRVTITDFKALPGGLISKPRIMCVFAGGKLVDSDVDYFMRVFLDKMGEAFEDMCALLCDANIKPFGPFETRVVTRQSANSGGPRRYQYFSRFKDGFQPDMTPAEKKVD